MASPWTIIIVFHSTKVDVIVGAVVVVVVVVDGGAACPEKCCEIFWLLLPTLGL